ncbi:MAG: hypothetical protein ABIK89_00840 [Planctomycetota bacterium]
MEVVFRILADAALADLLDEKERLVENCDELRSRPNAAERAGVVLGDFFRRRDSC